MYVFLFHIRISKRIILEIKINKAIISLDTYLVLFCVFPKYIRTAFISSDTNNIELIGHQD